MAEIRKLDPKKRKRRKRTSRLILALCALLAGTIIWSVISHPPPAIKTLQTEISAYRPAKFGSCFTGGGFNCVVDGDTFWMDGERIRVADIDAPETHPPRCDYEAQLGRRATDRLRELLNDGPIELEAADRDKDVYGRKLRIVTRNGESLGDQLVQEGLARPWTGSRQPWC
jgi:endonuclease YncB( thermonuclease family)